MGCDGGTIPRRDELVKTKKKPEQVDKDAENVAKWKHCSLTQDELKKPIVACELGRLYNKDSVIEYLLDKSKGADVAGHVRSLKDVTELKLTDNPAFDRLGGADKGDEYIDYQMSRYICPVVGMEMNGKHKFCYFRKCGCVMSKRALELVKSDNCHKCGKPRDQSSDDVILLNGVFEEVQELRSKMEARRLKQKEEKKAKKTKTSSSSSAAIGVADGEPPSKKSVSFTSTSSSMSSGGGVNGGKASTSKNGGSKLALSSKPTTSTTSTSSLSSSEVSELSKASISKDPTKSEAFKSLFTTHKSFKERPKAHWVTYNPLFN